MKARRNKSLLCDSAAVVKQVEPVAAAVVVVVEYRLSPV